MIRTWNREETNYNDSGLDSDSSVICVDGIFCSPSVGIDFIEFKARQTTASALLAC